MKIFIKKLMAATGLGFYSHMTNWHKHPLISSLLCKIGRHDYECTKETNILYCFYCGHLRHSVDVSS